LQFSNRQLFKILLLQFFLLLNFSVSGIFNLEFCIFGRTFSDKKKVIQQGKIMG